MKKILFAAHSGEMSGGANRSLLSVMTHLKRDYDVLPCVLIPGRDTPLRRACEQAGIEAFEADYHTCCTVYRGGAKDALRFMKLAAAPVLDWLKAGSIDRMLPGNIDAVYTNERMTAAGAFIARRRRIPHIWHVRSFGAENRTHYPFYWMKLMEAYSSRIVLISGALYSGFERAGVKKDKLRMIHNGVEREKYRTELPLAHEGFHMVLAGRIVPAKGQIEAIEAMGELVRQYRTDVHLHLAGEIPSYEGSDYYKKCFARVKEYGLEERVHFEGEIEDMAEFRRSMDAELVCSWCETFGRVTVEAMLAGLPVVGTDAGGTPEIIRDGETGYLYPSGRAERLAGCILSLYRNPGLRREMGEAGRARAEKYFLIERTTERIHQVIEEALAEHRG